MARGTLAEIEEMQARVAGYNARIELYVSVVRQPYILHYLFELTYLSMKIRGVAHGTPPCPTVRFRFDVRILPAKRIAKPETRCLLVGKSSGTIIDASCALY